MWIFDSYYKGSVELWSRDKRLTNTNTSTAYPPCIYMHLKDPAAYREMIEGLESRRKVEECTFRTIYGVFEGYRIYADRSVAENIEKQTNTWLSSTTWMSGRTSDTWQSMISSPAAIEMSPDSRLILRSL